MISDEDNYLREKAKVALGRVYLAKKEIEKGKTIVEMARDKIKSIYKEDHPLLAKFNANLIEALNSTPESEERT